MLKYRKLKKMIEGEFEDKSKDWDSDDDLSEVSLKQGEKIDM